MALAYLAALGCALCYGLGSVLQSIGAKRVAAGDRLDPRLLARVATQTPYLAGLGLDGLGWALSLVALVRLPLFAVQAVVAASMGFVVLFAALIEKIRPTRRQVGILVVLGLGLLGLAATAAPEKARAVTGAFTVAVWIGVAVVGLAGVAAPRALESHRASATLGALAGLAFGGTALCARARGDRCQRRGGAGRPVELGAGGLRDSRPLVLRRRAAAGIGDGRHRVPVRGGDPGAVGGGAGRAR